MSSRDKAQRNTQRSVWPKGVLQRKCAGCGNHTVAGSECEDCKKKSSSLLQTKLSVGSSGDVYEREADRVADQVIGTNNAGAVKGAPVQIQRHQGEQSDSAVSAPASVDQVLSESGALAQYLRE